MFVGGTIGAAGPAVAGAIRNAASATGTKFEYLLATARVESGFNPAASAKTSSAGGLFQFIDRTWLSTLKQAGPNLGYGKYAAAISQDAKGNYSVSDPAMRQKIMALRQDPAANAAMAGAFTRANAAQLAANLGRSATEGELYMAHFLGANGASRLISLAADNPKASAASLFPKAAQANRSIFYDETGGARSVSDVYSALAGRYATARASVGTALASAQPPVQPAAAATASAVTPLSNIIVAATASDPTSDPTAARAFADNRVASSFQSLFAAGRGGPVSHIVRDLWTTRPRVAAALSGVDAPALRASSATKVATASNVVSAAETVTAQPVQPVTPSERVRNIFNDLLSSLHT